MKKDVSAVQLPPKAPRHQLQARQLRFPIASPDELTPTPPTAPLEATLLLLLLILFIGIEIQD